MSRGFYYVELHLEQTYRFSIPLEEKMTMVEEIMFDGQRLKSEVAPQTVVGNIGDVYFRNQRAEFTEVKIESPQTQAHSPNERQNERKGQDKGLQISAQGTLLHEYVPAQVHPEDEDQVRLYADIDDGEIPVKDFAQGSARSKQQYLTSEHDDYNSAHSCSPSPFTPPDISSIVDAVAEDHLQESTAVSSHEASSHEASARAISAFAKLEFNDGCYFMNTYSIILGRDTRLIQRSTMERNLDIGCGDELQDQSLVGDIGGFIGAVTEDEEPGRKRKRKTSKSTASSSYSLPRRNSKILSAPPVVDYQSMIYFDNPGDASLGPEACPILPIHPPTEADPNSVTAGGVSRKHAKIGFNFDKGLFEIQVMGKNGVFLDDIYYEEGQIAELRSGSKVQVGGVVVRFLLPDVAIGETGAEGHLASEPSAMSLDFEDGRGEDIEIADTVESISNDDEDSDISGRNIAEQPSGMDQMSSDEGDDNEDQKVDETEDAEETAMTVPVKQAKQSIKLLKLSKPSKTAKSKPEPKIVPQVDIIIPPRKRKGPGRPPKNGIISKREQALLARQAREAAKAEASKNETVKSGKGKSSVMNNDVVASSPQPEAKVEKRKYTKRKKLDDPNEEPSQVQEVSVKTESTLPENAQVMQAPKPTKEKRPPKPPRSPSPVWDETLLTEEQLAKPSQSYVVLIHDALSNSATGQMSLPQIYRAIERKYPYYKLRVTTQGWQSSVRHNLSQNPCFQKIERDGKGWMWGLVEGAGLPEAKKVPQPPPNPPNPGSYPYPHTHPYNNYPFHPPQMNPAQPHLNMHLGFGPGLPYNPNGFSGHPNGYPFAISAHAEGNSSEYKSPYEQAPKSQPAPQASDSKALPPITSQNGTGERLEDEKDATAIIETPQDPHKPTDDTHIPYPTHENLKPTDGNGTSYPIAAQHGKPQPQQSEAVNELISEQVPLFKKTLLTALKLDDAEKVVTDAINFVLIKLGLLAESEKPQTEVVESVYIRGAFEKYLVRQLVQLNSSTNTPSLPHLTQSSKAPTATKGSPPPSTHQPSSNTAPAAETHSTKPENNGSKIQYASELAAKDKSPATAINGDQSFNAAKAVEAAVAAGAALDAIQNGAGSGMKGSLEEKRHEAGDDKSGGNGEATQRNRIAV